MLSFNAACRLTKAGRKEYVMTDFKPVMPAPTPEPAAAAPAETPVANEGVANAESATLGAVAVPAYIITEAGEVVTVQVGLVIKRYQTLSSMPTGQGLGRVMIGRCSAMLANRMQCWRAGDFYIQDSSVAQPYQKCRMHASMELAADEAAIKAATTPAAPPAAPTSVQLP
jgi:hypothetical protein